MKRFLSILLCCLVALPLTSCVELLNSGLGGGYGGGGSHYGNGGGYHSQPRDYRDQRHDRRDYDERYREECDHPSHHNHGRSNHYGGPEQWYKSGVGVGRADRKRHVSPNYRRHSNHFDKRTEGQFARGYDDGYHH